MLNCGRFLRCWVIVGLPPNIVVNSSISLMESSMLPLVWKSLEAVPNVFCVPFMLKLNDGDLIVASSKLLPLVMEYFTVIGLELVRIVPSIVDFCGVFFISRRSMDMLSMILPLRSSTVRMVSVIMISSSIGENS